MLKRPLISEKSMNITKDGFYTFLVSLHSTKKQIAKLVKDRFKVDVLSVRTINVVGKNKTQRSRKGFFNTSPIKKAIVQIKKGQKIPIFEVAEEEKEEVKVTTAEGEVIGTTKEKKSLLRRTKVKIEKNPAVVKDSGEAKKEAK